MVLALARPQVLAALVVLLSVALVVLACMFASYAPAASVALFCLIAGGVVGFVVESADGPAGVPWAVAVYASAGFGIGGLTGLFVARGRGSARSARRAAIWTVAAAPFAGALLTVALQVACPLYVTGKKSSYCNYQQVDVLGAWVTGVVFLFLLCTVWLAAVLGISSWQAAGWPGEEPKR
jgi:hypothetical protein